MSIKKSDPGQSQSPFMGEREFSKSMGLSASVSFSSPLLPNPPPPPTPPPIVLFFFCVHPVLERPVRFSPAGNGCYAGYPFVRKQTGYKRKQ